ncbi:hypothetical protein GOB93_19965 [Acetobacter musti]|uniref:Uncharacterized protein n=1 Tax=Acetobacter musti TaxID=864732 RepID=A0ABX0JXW7_9PROT|nr:hypothetical protein [Acetobacter musti]NHN86855.1 hypothetical protein [Acetobacter musti]
MDENNDPLVRIVLNCGDTARSISEQQYELAVEREDRAAARKWLEVFSGFMTATRVLRSSSVSPIRVDDHQDEWNSDQES